MGIAAEEAVRTSGLRSTVHERQGRQANRVGLGGIGVKNGRQTAHSDSSAHDDGHFVDEITGASRDNCGAEDFIGALSYVDLYEAVILSIRDRTIGIVHHHGETLNGNGLLSGLARVHSDMGDLRIAIGTPRNR
jgi:hypothetical protein